VVLAAACDQEAPVLVRVEIVTPAERGIEVDDAPPVLKPAEAVLDLARLGPTRWGALLAVRPSAVVTVAAAGTCVESVPSEVLTGQRSPARIVLDPLFSIDGERDQVGFGRRFTVEAKPMCPEAEREAVEWRVVGDEIAGLAVAADGRTVSGTMPSFEEATGGSASPGIVPISPRTRGTRALRARVLGADGGVLFEREISIHAAARATGLPSVAIGARTYLGGEGWSVLRGPLETHAIIEPRGAGISTFVPDLAGRYVLADGAGGGLAIAAGSHAATPLDCGRRGCHRVAASTIRSSAMTTVGARFFESAAYAPACALSCHAAGEPGVSDGGAVDTAIALGWSFPARGGEGAWDALPRELRRLAGVGCTACHGPGAIPPPSASTRILRSDVCAVCHDAPPRYGHVLAWRASRLSRADETAGSRERPECARCHTTAGFLLSVAGTGRSDVLAPPAEPAGGITCAACHASHGHGSGVRLLRRPPLPALVANVATMLVEDPSRTCLPCHTPDPDRDLPTASAVALLIGRGGLGQAGEGLVLDAPHARLERGCLACHGTGAVGGVERGAGHAFLVDPGVCDACHERPIADRSAELAARATDLAGTLARRGLARPTLASSLAGAPTTDLARARYDVALVLLDRGAWAHAGPAAFALLDRAEALTH